VIVVVVRLCRVPVWDVERERDLLDRDLCVRFGVDGEPERVERPVVRRDLLGCREQRCAARPIDVLALRQTHTRKRVREGQGRAHRNIDAGAAQDTRERNRDAFGFGHRAVAARTSSPTPCERTRS
jgi:hypothetical protein